MLLLHDIREFRQAGCVLALGTFDGVHRGHKTLLLRTVELAKKAGTPEQKRALIGHLGIDVLVEQPFTQQWATQTPERFLREVCRAMHPQTLVVGSNYTFGRGAMGTVETLRQEAENMGFGLDVIPPILWAGEMVSSTRIRQLLAAGYPAEAEMMAGHALSGAIRREE